MRRLLVLSTIILSLFSVSACSASQVEQEPVTIENGPSEGAALLTSPASVTPTSNPSPDESSSGHADDNTVSSASSTDTSSANQTGTPSASPNDTPSVSIAATDTSSELYGYISENAYPAVIELEGTEETVNYKTYHSNLGYQMAFDVDRFSTISTQFEDGSWKDSFVAENPNPDIYPLVYISILRGVYLPSVIPRFEDFTGSLSSFYPDFKNYIDVKDDKGFIITGIGLKESDELITQDTLQFGDYKAYHYVVKKGNDWNSRINDDYFIVANDYIYLICSSYYLEASEGYGARIREMVKSITFEKTAFE